MDKVYEYCQALKFRNEATGMCCASVKVVLLPLPTPPEPLKSLLAGHLGQPKFAIPNLMDVILKPHLKYKAKCII